MKYIINLIMLIASTLLVIAMIYSNPFLNRTVYTLMGLSFWGCCLFKFMFLSDKEDK